MRCSILVRVFKRHFREIFLLCLLAYLLILFWFSGKTDTTSHSHPFSVFLETGNTSGTTELQLGPIVTSPITVGVVTCDEPGQFNSSTMASVMIKSVLISAKLYNVPRVDFHIFLEHNDTRKFFESKLEEFGYPNPNTQVEVNFHFHSVLEVVPKKYHGKMLYIKHLRCTYVRHYIPTHLVNVGEIVYMDADTIVTGDISKFWNLFRGMTGQKLIGAAQNTEIIGTDYGVFKMHFAGIPHIKPRGLNAGILLMNLTKMRNFQWPEKFVEAYNNYSKQYNLKYSQDQGVLNIFLQSHPELLKQFPCNFNYHHVHCDLQICLAAEEDQDGIQIMHGAGKQFTRSSSHLYPIYEAYKNFDMRTCDLKRDLILPLRLRLSTYVGTSIRRNCYSKLQGLLFKGFT